MPIDGVSYALNNVNRKLRGRALYDVAAHSRYRMRLVACVFSSRTIFYLFLFSFSLVVSLPGLYVSGCLCFFKVVWHTSLCVLCFLIVEFTTLACPCRVYSPYYARIFVRQFEIMNTVMIAVLPSSGEKSARARGVLNDW